MTELEAVIERGLHTFVDVGTALLEIRDQRLYRERWASFEDYCRERWGMSRPRAYQIIDAAKVVAALSTNVDTLPGNEAQVRPLTALPPEQQREAWTLAVETAPGGKVTGAHVEQTVAKLTGTAQAMAVTVFSHESVDYYTPPVYIEAAREVMGSIDLDPASCEAAQANVKATHFLTERDDGLSVPWFGRVWLNPPYSKTDGESNQAIWSQYLVREYQAGHVSEAILLVKAALGYKWFEDLWWSWPVCFARERISFIRPDGTDDGQSKQATAFVYLGQRFERFAEVFRGFGRVIPPERT